MMYHSEYKVEDPVNSGFVVLMIFTFSLVSFNFYFRWILNRLLAVAFSGVYLLLLTLFSKR
jgi:predicted outer membrane lipoprotein